MKYFLALFVSLFAIQSSYAVDAEVNWDKIDKSVVKIIEVRNNVIVGSGTGWAINNGGYFVTNEHVVKGIDEGGNILIVDKDMPEDKFDRVAYGEDGKPIFVDGKLKTVPVTIHVSAPVVVKYKNPENDLAIIVSDDVSRPGLPLNTAPLKKGDGIMASGFPEAAGFFTREPSDVDGIVSNFMDGNIKYIQINNALNPGNSGGPVINECEQVIGVVSFKPKKDSEGIAWAIQYLN